MGQFDTFVAVQVTDEGERDYEFPECLLQNCINPCMVQIITDFVPLLFAEHLNFYHMFTIQLFIWTNNI